MAPATPRAIFDKAKTTVLIGETALKGETSRTRGENMTQKNTPMNPNPQFPYSAIGQKLTGKSGILSLMDDLGRALTQWPDMRMLGGGNPAPIPALQARLRERWAEMLTEGSAVENALGNYDPPQGNPRFVKAVADLLRREFGWAIGPENVGVTAGGQTAFFYLFNLLAGKFADGTQRKILLPLCPEYIGYADQGLGSDLFVACRPNITWPDGPESRRFKYTIDFAAVEAALRQGNIAAIAASRPTNPTGNVLTDAEVQQLSDLAEHHGIPLILDNAYGAPWPGVIYTEATPFWAPHTILTLSLSKLGLPGTRTAIVIAPEKIIQALGGMTAICGLANGNLGQQLVLPWVESGEILTLGRDVIKPFYQERGRQATEWLRQSMDAAGVNWALHVSEGAFFHWLWLKDIKISTADLYERLKARKVLIVPGAPFIFDLAEPWEHGHQCLRINFAQDPVKVQEALAIIAQEAAAAQ